MTTTQNLEMDVIKMLNAAGTTLGRIFQQAEEAFLDIPRTEYTIEYKDNIKKVDFLILLTQKLISDFEVFLQANSEPIDKMTQIEEFGTVLQSPLEETKFYSSLFNKDLVKVGKYQNKLGVAFNAYIKKESETYIKKLRKMLEVDLKRFKEEEEILENLRLDHDYLKNRMNNAYTTLGRAALEKEFEKVRHEFESYYEKTLQYFKTVDSYFTIHRVLLKEFVEIQRNYYRDCDKNLSILLRKLYNDVYRITYDTQVDGYAEEIISSSDVDEKIKKQKLLELSKVIEGNKRKKETQIERFTSVMKNGVMLIHFQRDDKLDSITESGKSPTTPVNRNRYFSDNKQPIELVNNNSERISQKSGLFVGDLENKSFSINNESYKSMSDENRDNSIEFNGDVIVSLSSEIVPQESNNFPFDETETISPSVVLTEKSEMAISNDEIIPFTDFQSNIEFPEKETTTGAQDISYFQSNIEFPEKETTTGAQDISSNSSPDIDAVTNVKMGNEENIKLAVSTNYGVSPSVEEFEVKTPEIINAASSSLKWENSLTFDENISKEPEINKEILDTVLSLNINSEPELESLKLDDDLTTNPATGTEISMPSISLNLNQSLDEEGCICKPDSIELDPEVFQRSINTHEAPSTLISLNINSELEIQPNLGMEQISTNLITEPEVNIKGSDYEDTTEPSVSVNINLEPAVKLDEVSDEFSVGSITDPEVNIRGSDNEVTTELSVSVNINLKPAVKLDEVSNEFSVGSITDPEVNIEGSDYENTTEPSVSVNINLEPVVKIDEVSNEVSVGSITDPEVNIKGSDYEDTKEPSVSVNINLEPAVKLDEVSNEVSVGSITDPEVNVKGSDYEDTTEPSVSVNINLEPAVKLDEVSDEFSVGSITDPEVNIKGSDYKDTTEPSVSVNINLEPVVKLDEVSDEFSVGSITDPEVNIKGSDYEDTTEPSVKVNINLEPAVKLDEVSDDLSVGQITDPEVNIKGSDYEDTTEPSVSVNINLEPAVKLDEVSDAVSVGPITDPEVNVKGSDYEDTTEPSVSVNINLEPAVKLDEVSDEVSVGPITDPEINIKRSE